MDSLTPLEAAEFAGVPAAQLIRWAWEDWDVYERRASGLVGPRNVGTRHKPMYRQADVVAWRSRAAAANTIARAYGGLAVSELPATYAQDHDTR